MMARVQRSYSDLPRDRTKTIAFQKRNRAMLLAKCSALPPAPRATTATKMAAPRAIRPILTGYEKKGLR